MSFSISSGIVADTDEACAALTEKFNAVSHGDSEAEHRQQLAAIIEAVPALAKAIGDGGPFYVSASGHANPGFVERQGWSGSTVSVSITHATAQVPA